jgi:hypothetical protein
MPFIQATRNFPLQSMVRMYSSAYFRILVAYKLYKIHVIVSVLMKLTPRGQLLLQNWTVTQAKYSILSIIRGNGGEN